MNRSALVLAVTAASASAFAGSTWDEAADGDLSNDISAPTNVGSLDLGSNIIRNSVSGPDGAGGTDFDVFSFEIASGSQLAAIILNDYQSQDGISFLALAAGGVAPADPNLGNISGYIGAILFGTSLPGDSIGDDLLDGLGGAALGGTGASLPLGPGTYTIFVQQTGTTTDLEFDFQVVPAPASAAILGLGGLVATRRRR